MVAGPERRPGDVPHPDFYSELGRQEGRCATVYSDWADETDQYVARICQLDPRHVGFHQGPAASECEIEQAARRNTQDSSR